MTVSITECTEPAELWRHYSQQYDAQPCYIELGLKDGVLLASYDADIGSATPDVVYHGIDRRYSIPILTGEAANRVMREILPLAERILADSKVEWSGTSWIGVLGDDAQVAEEELREHLGLPTPGNGYRQEANQGFDESDLVAIWTIDGVVNGQETVEYGITADTTDERLDAIEAEILSDMSDCGSGSVAVCHGLDAHLRELRDDLRRERDDTG